MKIREVEAKDLKKEDWIRIIKRGRRVKVKYLPDMKGESKISDKMIGDMSEGELDKFVDMLMNSGYIYEFNLDINKKEKKQCELVFSLAVKKTLTPISVPECIKDCVEEMDYVNGQFGPKSDMNDLKSCFILLKEGTSGSLAKRAAFELQGSSYHNVIQTWYPSTNRDNREVWIQIHNFQGYGKGYKEKTA